MRKIQIFFSQKIKYGCGGNVFSSQEKASYYGNVSYASPGSDLKQLIESQQHNPVLLVVSLASHEHFPLVAASEGPVEVAGGSLFPLAEMVCSQVKRCHGCIKKVNTQKNKMQLILQ